MTNSITTSNTSEHIFLAFLDLVKTFTGATESCDRPGPKTIFLSFSDTQIT